MTDAQIIDELGGTGAVARALSKSDATISLWRRRGIARDMRFSVARLAKEKDVRLPADFLVPLS